jgi:hypothetical protein
LRKGIMGVKVPPPLAGGGLGVGVGGTNRG